MKKIIQFLGLKKAAIALALDLARKILADNGILIDASSQNFNFTIPYSDAASFLPKFFLDKIKNSKYSFTYSDGIKTLDVEISTFADSILIAGTQTSVKQQ